MWHRVNARRSVCQQLCVNQECGGSDRRGDGRAAARGGGSPLLSRGSVLSKVACQVNLEALTERVPDALCVLRSLEPPSFKVTVMTWQPTFCTPCDA
jgi:hypothetical protein